MASGIVQTGQIDNTDGFENAGRRRDTEEIRLSDSIDLDVLAVDGDKLWVVPASRPQAVLIAVFKEDRRQRIGQDAGFYECLASQKVHQGGLAGTEFARDRDLGREQQSV